MAGRSILAESIIPLLERAGVKYRDPNTKGWINLEVCPVCGHSGYQCGVHEAQGGNGRLLHKFKCQHTDVWRYTDFLRALGCDVPEKATPTFKSANPQKVSSEDRPLNLEANDRYQKRLRENPDALNYLFSRGLTEGTTIHFRLGLTDLYSGKDGERGLALAYPMIDANGTFRAKYANYNVPGVTVNPVDKNGWMKGDVRTYYSGSTVGREILIVCEGAKDLWMLHQQIQRSDLAEKAVLITSTHGSGKPQMWHTEEFWRPYSTIYLAHDNDEAGDKIAMWIAEHAGREVDRVKIPREYGKDLTDYFKAGGDLEGFMSLLALAQPVTQSIDTTTDDLSQTGRLAYTPVDINGAYHKGHLYYTAQTLVREWIETQKGNDIVQCLVETKETVVIRSDGQVLTVKELPARPGAKRNNTVLRLSDGTLIDKALAPNPYATWSWDSILKFQKARQDNRLIMMRPLCEIYTDVRRYLENKIWLQFRDDYTVLALAAVATYCQPVFEAIPLFLVNGPKGSGKTEIGQAMCHLAANSTMIGQASAATIARIIDQSRGFVVLDDLESVGRKKDDQFTELVQGLKLGYKKSTGTKLWTDVKTMEVHRLNFYGIKMINNTGGVDSILGSRMMIIQTRKRLPAETEDWECGRDEDVQTPNALRDELHTWAFNNVVEIDKAYSNIYAQGRERSEEISAPLRALAAMTGNDQVVASLERVLKRQNSKPYEYEEPQDLLEEAFRNLVLEGFQEVIVQHLINEMLRIAPPNFCMEKTTDIPCWQQNGWVGKTARANGLVNTEESPRIRFLDMQFRILTIADSFLISVREQMESSGEEMPSVHRKATDFCTGCSTCPYRAVGCELMNKKC